MSERHTIEETATRLDSLRLWEKMTSARWALKRRGSAVPYFCAVVVPNNKLVKSRLLLLEGWQTLHDFLLNQKDRWFGVIDSPLQMPHYEVTYLQNGRIEILRYDSCYLPRKLNEGECETVAKMLWQVYGVMMRIESGEDLMLKYASENSIFARIEQGADEWVDAPMKIVQPRTYVEKFSLPKDELSKAKDLPFDRGLVMMVDFVLDLNIKTVEERPRYCYRFIGNTPDQTVLFDQRFSPNPDGGLKAMWEQMPRRLLAMILHVGRIPGEVRVRSGRLFRFLRPLGVELPFRLTFSASENSH